MKEKSPFLVKQEFVSPLMCEQFVSELDTILADVDVNGTPLKKTSRNEENENTIFERVQHIIPEIERWYNIQYSMMEEVAFEWFPEGSAEGLHAENSNYLRKKWVRVKNRDLTGIIFLSDYRDKVPFESLYEVYGGKLEFPQHGFSFNPERGTLIIFPSGPHFINSVSEIKAGELHYAKFHIVAKSPFLYDPTKFPGDYRTWFKQIA